MQDGKGEIWREGMGPLVVRCLWASQVCLQINVRLLLRLISRRMGKVKEKEERAPMIVRCQAVGRLHPEQQQQASARTGTLEL
jgi:hypothetical protein